MDLLLIGFCLLMAIVLTLAGMAGNRTLAQRAAPAAPAGAGSLPSATTPSVGPAGTAAIGHR